MSATREQPSGVSPTPRKRRRGPKLPTRWQDKYLAALQAHGGFYKAAEDAGVSYEVSLGERNRDPAFEDACLKAKELWYDEMQRDLVANSRKTGNPIGLLAALKTGRKEYIEKQLIAQLTVNTEALPVEQVTALLRGMLGDATTPTRGVLVSSSAVATTAASAVGDSTGFDAAQSPQEKDQA